MKSGLVAGNGFSFNGFLKRPRVSTLISAVINNRVENEGWEEKSTYLAKLSILSNKRFDYELKDLVRIDRNIASRKFHSFVQLRPIFLFILFRALFGSEEDCLKIRDGVLSDNKYLRLLCLEALCLCCDWSDPLPFWLTELLLEYEEKWGGSSYFKNIARSELRNGTFISNWALGEFSKELDGVFFENDNSVCCNSSDRSFPFLKGFVSSSPLESMRKIQSDLPLCISLWLDLSSEKKLSDSLIKALNGFSFCSQRSELIGMFMGKMGSRKLFEEWISLNNKWPNLSFPDEMLSGFLFSVDPKTSLKICQNVDFMFGHLGYSLTRVKLEWLESGRIEQLDFKKLFREASKFKNALAENTLANYLSSQKKWSKLPLEEIDNIFKGALFLRVRYKAFAHCYKSLKLDDLILCLFDASGSIRELAFEEILTRNNWEKYKDIFLKVSKDPLNSQEFRERVKLFC